MDTTDRDLKQVGLRLRALRERHGWTQADVTALLVARGVDIIQTSLSHYEVGRRSAPLSIIAELARLYNTSIDYIMGLTDNPAPVVALEKEIGAAKGNSEFDQLLRRLPPGKQEQVLGLARYLLAVEESSAAEKNRRAFTAVLNVVNRKLGSRATTEVLNALSREYPDLDALVTHDGERQLIRAG